MYQTIDQILVSRYWSRWAAISTVLGSATLPTSSRYSNLPSSSSLDWRLCFLFGIPTAESAESSAVADRNVDRFFSWIPESAGRISKENSYFVRLYGPNIY